MKSPRVTQSIRAGIILLLALASAPSARAATYLVASGGADSAGCGGAGSPCLTLSYALGQAIGPGDVIELAAETRAISAEIVVTKSGEPGDPLVIRGAGIGATVLDGAGLPSNTHVLTLEGSDIAVQDMTLTTSPLAPLLVTGADVTVRRVRATYATGNTANCMWFNGAVRPLLEDVETTGCKRQGIVFQGATGLVVERALVIDAGSRGIQVSSADTAALRGVRVIGAGAVQFNSPGIYVSGCEQLEIGASDAAGAVVLSLIADAGGGGIQILDATTASIQNTIFMTASSAVEVVLASSTALDLTLDQVTITGTTDQAAVLDSSGLASLTVTNSVLAFNPGGDLPATLGSLSHAHNLRHLNGSGNVALGSDELDADPLFADLAGGDVHLLSQHGRYAPASGWVTDAQTSPAIDLADPGAPFANEPGPNGGRANAGAFGNTAQASMSSSGSPTDAAMPDLVQPDALLPDTLLADTLLPDAAQLDAARPDVVSPDAAFPDVLQPDSAQVDGAQADGAQVDALGPDTQDLDAGAHDLVTGQDLGAGLDRAGDPDGGPPDTTALDTVATDRGAVVIARAGTDFETTVPDKIVLDGQQSEAPAGSTFTWTVADGPQGPVVAPVGTQPITTFSVEQPGIWVFQLTVSAGGVSDSDQVAVTAMAEGEAAVEGCGCGVAEQPDRGRYAALMLLALLLLGRQRRSHQHDRGIV